MSVLKYKDDNGAWVEVDNTIFAPGSLKQTVITKASNTTFDLSPYIAPGSTDFILLFTWGDYSGGQTHFYRYAFIDGKLAAPPYEDGLTQSNNPGITKTVGTNSDDTGFFFKETEASCTYNTTTCIFKMNGMTNDKLGTSAVLIYAK